MDIQVYLNVLRQKGHLAYEYHPFRNYLTEEDLYLIDKKFLVPKGCAVDPNNGEILVKKIGDKWINKEGKEVIGAKSTSDEYLFAKAGSLIDLDTDKLNFDINHPVELEILPSYDGSVNVIFNDDKNIPRLINSRFSAREKDTYEIVDRIGENDTNIYSSKSFEKDTSLYFQYNKNPIIDFLGYVDGVFPVGQYCFYFTYCDADDNESDIIAETGVIPAFIGDNGNPFSMDGGIKNLLSNKGIKLKLSDIDGSYNYLKIYYVRYFADYLLNRVYECKKIYLKYPTNNSSSIIILITGNERTEDLDANILNLSKFNPKSILTLAQCKNMLFFGNIVKNTDNYRELTDCALRIIPSLAIDSIDLVDNDYSTNTGYYDSNLTYTKTGYFPQEYYRFGVVFIYLNGTLSNVYNTLGYILENTSEFITCKQPLWKKDGIYYNRQYINVDDKGRVKDYSDSFILNPNSKGVCKINYNPGINEVIGIKFTIPKEVSEFLKNDLGIRGLFFVRQKCVPNIIAQCYLLPMDEVMKGPVIKYDGDKCITETFLKLALTELDEEAGLLTLTYTDRLYEYDNNLSISSSAYAAICPDFLLNQPYYNLIFNGSGFYLKPAYTFNLKQAQTRFYIPERESINVTESNVSPRVTICSVTEDVPLVAIKNYVYKLEMGVTEEAYKFAFAGHEVTWSIGENNLNEDNKGTNFVRGKFSPYLAIYSPFPLSTNVLYNIYKENSNDLDLEFLNRMNSYEPFYAISNRYNFNQLNKKDEDYYLLICYRGDCFINLFTYRLNRNFNDPSLPNNDIIIQPDTWQKNYKPNSPEEWVKISRSDVNAVMLGSWITFPLRSAMNYAYRSVDHSYVSEEALMGSPRSFYPRSSLLYRGANKMPDSYLYNDAYRATLGFKCYYTLQDINYIKDTFSNRILYSAISIQDSYKNNYRESFSTYYRDYSQEYGSILKLIGFEGYLLVVFEHAIGIAVVNERVLAGNGDGEPVFINTKNVLPEELTIISDTYGTQWGDSVVKSEAGYVYGVDTIAKKIWRVRGQNIEIISDGKVNKFLIDNITLGEREKHPIIGLRNVKTHYNNNKKDIMFTFYDDVYKDEEKVWNLCYNETLDQFITFYSWVPSFSENIDTQFFTFNRDTAKCLSLLNKCNYHISDNSGVLLDTPVLDANFSPIRIYYRDKINYTIKKYGENDFEYNFDYDVLDKSMIIERDHWGNYKWFDPIKKLYYIITNRTVAGKLLENGLIVDRIVGKNDEVKCYYDPENNDISEILSRISEEDRNTISDVKYEYQLKVKDDEESREKVRNWFKTNPVLYLEITPENEHTETIVLTTEDILNNLLLTNEDIPNLTTDFYLHGQAGTIDILENVYPTHWYGKTHPFEFEFIVNDKIAQLKIFTNLAIIANKVEPESFHFEIEGDNYEFSEDKRNMYYRLEATKQVYQSLGSNILYNRFFTDVGKTNYTKELYYRGTGLNKDIVGWNYNEYSYKNGMAYPQLNSGLVQLKKSTLFPLYYERIDTFNDIYHNYQLMKGDMYDFQNLSGSEITWNRDLNQFNIITHIKNNPIDKVGRLRGNSRYKEGIWKILIPSINFMQKNEDKWNGNVPPIVINSLNVPDDLTDNKISADKLPNTYIPSKENPVSSYIDTKDWTYRKETKIRDKWMKVRVRYSGENLAIIHSLITLYDISYS